MAEVASAFVSVMPSASGFGRKLDSEIGGDIDSSGKRAGSRFGAALKVGALGVLAGAAFVGKFLSDSLEEAREAQKVGALTESTIKATGQAANVTAKQVGELAEAISLKTGIDDETIQSGQNMLLTFKNIRNEVGKGNDIFDQATSTLVDMSSAMGTEPKQAAIQLGKALNDPIKGISALSRVGVTFSEGQKKVIERLVETGRTAKAQKAILRELNSEFGGAAEAQATAGDKMEVAWGNLKEAAGNAILPVVDTWLPKLTNGINWLTERIQNRDWGAMWGTFKTASRTALNSVATNVQTFTTDRLIPAIGRALTRAHGRWAKGWDGWWKDPEKSYDQTLLATETFGEEMRSKTVSIGVQVIAGFMRSIRGLPAGTARVGVSTIRALQKAWNGAPGLARHIAIDISGNFIGGLRSMPGTARGIAIDVGLDLIGGFRTAIDGANAIGAAIINGLVDGITDTASRVADAAAKVVLDAIQAARNAAGIKSPSRVFMEIGHQTVEGLALGIEGNSRRATSAMDRLSAGIAVRGPGAMTAAAAGAGGGGRAVFHIYDRDDVLLGTMEGVADGRINGHAQLSGETARAM